MIFSYKKIMNSYSGENPEDQLKQVQKGKIVAIKYGGNAMTDLNIKQGVVEDICQLKKEGFYPVVIHGGGPVIQQTLDVAGVKSTFIDGHRKTTPEAMKYVEMALRGQVNGELVRLINLAGQKAIGLSGKDAAMVRVKKRIHFNNDGQHKQEIDLGHVGDVDQIDTSLVHLLLDNDFIPVIAPIGFCEDGKDYNINADMFAGNLAGALKAFSYIVLTNVNGLLADLNDPSSLLHDIPADELSQHIGKSIEGGMIPKVESCQIALEKGVHSAYIINGTVPHSLLNALLTKKTVGTQITR